MAFLARAASRPLPSLAAIFIAWKSYLLAIALGAAIAQDYDTSTSLFFERIYGADSRVPALAARLTRWDALYFMHAARNGYVYEQEWAFGMAFPGAIRMVMCLLGFLQIDTEDQVLEPLIGIAITHVSHLLSVFLLYKLTAIMSGHQKFAFITASLHIFSPAGMFLSAPYNESPYSCFSYLGILLYTLSLGDETNGLTASFLKVMSGVTLGLATAFRSNGLLNGLLFAVDAVFSLMKFIKQPTLPHVLAVTSAVAGGLGVAAGTVIPQVVAWQRYCSNSAGQDELRPWCSRTIPSIYAFVQEHYWNNGFLRYWTLNQLPLFCLASPVLVWMIISGTLALQEPSSSLRIMAPEKPQRYRLLVRTLATIQVALAVYAITHSHVQIITRLSSGYIVLYWYVAGKLLDRKTQGTGATIVSVMVMYGAVQGVLFASFLPPA